MELKESILKFDNYLVENINLKLNLSNEVKGDIVGIPVSLNRDLFKSVEDEKKFVIKLKIEIGKSDKVYPFELNLDLVGFFGVEEGESTDMIDNATAILFPYLRSTVTNITSLANINPYTIPVINIIDMFKEKSGK